MVEYIAIIDSDDKVIGKEEFRIVHQKKHLHRSSNVIAFRTSDKNEILLEKRADHNYKGGLYCFPGGHVEYDESYEYAAKREFAEEMYSDISRISEINLVFLDKFEKHADDDYEIISIFTSIIDDKFTIDKSEVDSYMFMPIDELFDDIEKHPEKYVETLIEITKRVLNRK